MEATATENAITGKVIVCIDGKDVIRDLSYYDLTFESSEAEILDRVRGSLVEELGQDIRDSSGSYLYKTRKATDSQNVYIIPNSTAG